jgi:hypothetical protein
MLHELQRGPDLLRHQPDLLQWDLHGHQRRPVQLRRLRQRLSYPRQRWRRVLHQRPVRQRLQQPDRQRLQRSLLPEQSVLPGLQRDPVREYRGRSEQLRRLWDRLPERLHLLQWSMHVQYRDGRRLPDRSVLLHQPGEHQPAARTRCLLPLFGPQLLLRVDDKLLYRGQWRWDLLRRAVLHRHLWWVDLLPERLLLQWVMLLRQPDLLLRNLLRWPVLPDRLVHLLVLSRRHNV